MSALTVQDGDAGLQIINLRKSYRKRLVIRDVSLNLGRGEVVALLGPNGSGKTTCFYAIAGLVTPEGGKVIIDGRDVTTLPMYRRARLGIGYLPQEMSIFRGMTVENRGIGVLITDHNVQETLQIVDRAYILHDGKVLMNGTTQEVINDENVRRVYLGNSFRVS